MKIILITAVVLFLVFSLLVTFALMKVAGDCSRFEESEEFKKQLKKHNVNIDNN